MIQFFRNLWAAFTKDWEDDFDPELYDLPQPLPTPPVAPPVPVPAPNPLPMTIGVNELYPDWNTQKHAFHNVRVLCDRAQLTLQEKNLICSVIYGESEFKNSAVCKNKNPQGVVTSIDVGLCQINSRFHTGPGGDFPSTEYVVAHPDEAVNWMLKQYKLGHLNWWIAYSSGRSAQFLKPNSVMWTLR